MSERPDISKVPADMCRRVVAFFWRGHTVKETAVRFSLPRDVVEEIIRERIRPGGYNQAPQLSGMFPGRRREA